MQVDSVDVGVPVAAPSLREGLVASVLLVAFCILPYLAVHHEAFLSPVLWWDEVFTHVLATDPDFGRTLRMTARETNPPTLYWLYRAATWIVGDAPAALRAVTLLWGAAALPAIYGLLRQAVGPLAAFGGTLALLACEPFQWNLLELRYYGLLTTVAAWTTLLGVRCFGSKRPAGRGQWIAFAVLSVLTCTLHWFGVIYYGLLMAPLAWRVLRADAYRPRQRLAQLALLAIGPAAVVMLLPLYLSQRHAFGGKTWIGPPDAEGMWEIFAFILNTRVLIVLTIALVIGFAFPPRRSPPPAGPRQSPEALTALRCLVAVLLVPLVLLAISLAMRPVVHVRYVAPALVALAAAAAICLSLVRSSVAIACVLALAALVPLAQRDAARQRLDNYEWTRSMPAYQRALARGGPTFFDSHNTAVTTTWLARRPGRFFLDETPVYVFGFTPDTAGPAGGGIPPWELLVQAEWEKVYPSPRSVPLEALPDRFVLVAMGYARLYRPEGGWNGYRAVGEPDDDVVELVREQAR